MAIRTDAIDTISTGRPIESQVKIRKAVDEINSRKAAHEAKKKALEATISESGKSTGLGKAFLDGFLDNTENTIDDQPLRKEINNTINTKTIKKQRSIDYTKAQDAKALAQAQALLDQEAAIVELDRQHRLYEMQLALANEYNRNGGK